MNTGIYKSSWLVICFNMFSGIIGGTILTIILNAFLPLPVAIAVAGGLGLYMVFISLVLSNYTIIFDDETITIKNPLKTVEVFARPETTITATVISRAVNSQCRMSLVDDGGELLRIDCSMFGRARFLRLAGALGVENVQHVSFIRKKRAH